MKVRESITEIRIAKKGRTIRRLSTFGRRSKRRSKQLSKKSDKITPPKKKKKWAGRDKIARPARSRQFLDSRRPKMATQPPISRKPVVKSSRGLLTMVEQILPI